MKNYKNLEIYQLAYKLAIEVHNMTMQLLNSELYEQVSQIRRSSKSIKDTMLKIIGKQLATCNLQP